MKYHTENVRGRRHILERTKSLGLCRVYMEDNMKYEPESINDCKSIEYCEKCLYNEDEIKCSKLLREPGRLEK